MVLEDQSRPTHRRQRGGTAPGGPPPAPPPGYEPLIERIQAYPRHRTYLLPALVDVQHELGWLPDWAIQVVGAHLRVPKSEAYGIASSFPELRLVEPPVQRLRLCMGASCRLAGAEGVLRDAAALDATTETADCLFICGVGPVAELNGTLIGRASLDRLAERTAPQRVEVAASANGQPTRRPRTRLIQDGTCSRAVGAARGSGTRVGCAGNCWQAPAISDDGGQTWRRADQVRAERDGATGAAIPADAGVWRQPGTVRLLASCGRRDPLAGGPNAYTALEKALSLGSTAVWQLVTQSGLRGRGGAYFPVGAKWETARNTQAERKFLLVNAEEGEPGIYKDRHLLEGDPQRIIEGAQIAALGIGATEVVIFVNGEAHLGAQRLQAALERARAQGALQVPTEVRLGAGGYVLGEETTLINAIHGLRAEPLARPPFPAVSGLFASPTVINNVESLANLPDILLHGADWFRAVGTDRTPGTKLVSLAGAVRQPGLYEVALGTPIGQIIDDCGGGATGPLGALLVGGPSGSILPASLLDTPFDVPTLQAVGGVLGAGGIVPLTDDQCVVQAVRDLVAYNARESCGKCTPCREGTLRLLGIFDDIRQGDATPTSVETIEYLNDILAFGSLCGLGQMAPNPVRSLLMHFGDVVAEHVRGVCRADVCFA